jgi:hypothetical protein
MIPRAHRLAAALLGLAAIASTSARAELKEGKPDLRSAGALAFGPDGLLFIGDAQGGALFAIDTGDRGPRPGEHAHVDIANLGQQLADLLGTTPQTVIINDVAVNPASGRVYVSAARGRGPDAQPVLVRAGGDGKLQLVELDNVRFDRAPLPNLPDANAQAGRPGQPSPRTEAITDLAFVDGRVFVAGLSNEEFASRLLAIPYPFGGDAQSTSVEIFHGAHGRFETRSPVRTFVAYPIDGKPHLLAAYTCTPLVKFPVAELKPGSHVKGTTIAELGNRNRPLDLIAYTQDGKPFLLMANSSRGVMKIPASGVGEADGIVQPVRTEKQGIGYDTVADLKGVVHLDKLDDAHAVVLLQAEDGSLNLQTIDLP